MSALNKKPTWANQTLRLDPYALPQKVSYGRATQSGATRGSQVEFTLDAEGAVMKRNLNCGLPLSMALPNRAFAGVAARAYENADGSNTVTLELLHFDADLSVPLCVADTVEEAAADWHSWAKKLGLPMLLIDSAGNATVVKDHSGVSSLAPKPRRRRNSMLNHRPNFLRRRKTGMIGPVVRINAREIIARN
ncbi:MAG: DUF6101 family protein [Rhizobiaceae bacterium]